MGLVFQNFKGFIHLHFLTVGSIAILFFSATRDIQLQVEKKNPHRKGKQSIPSLFPTLDVPDGFLGISYIES